MLFIQDGKITISFEPPFDPHSEVVALSQALAMAQMSLANEGVKEEFLLALSRLHEALFPSKEQLVHLFSPKNLK